MAKYAVHLLNVTGKGRYQPVLTAGYGPYSYQMLKEETNAGSSALSKLIHSSGVKRSAGVRAVPLLVVGAMAHVDAEAPGPDPMLTDAGPSTAPEPERWVPPGAAPERMKLGVFAKHIQTVQSTCRPGTFGQGKKHAVEGLFKTAPIGSGVGLLLWTAHEKNASGKGFKMTDATKRCVCRHGSVHRAAPSAHPPAHPPTHPPHLPIRPARHCPTSSLKAASCHRDSRAQGQGRAAQAGFQGGRSAA